MTNYFWVSRDRWPPNRQSKLGDETLVYLGHAVLDVGAALYPDWEDGDFAHLGLEEYSVPGVSYSEVTLKKAKAEFASGKRASDVAHRMLMAAEGGILELWSLPIRGGKYELASPDFFCHQRSLHIFKGCHFSRRRPLYERAPVEEWCDLYVSRQSLNSFLKRLPGAATTLSQAELRAWIEEKTESLTQRGLILEARATFRERAPSEQRIRDMDALVRRERGLEARTRGAPKKA